jgi:hypothetical protein
MIRLFVAIALLLCPFTAYGIAYPPPPKETKPDPDKMAKELGDAFISQAAKKDIDSLLKMVDYPYLTVGGKPLDKPEAVRRELGELLSGLLPDGSKVAVKEVVTPDKFETWANALPGKPEANKTDAARKALLDRIGPDGRIVAIQFEIEGKKDDDLCLLLVRFKDGKAVLVGLQD